MKIRYFSDTDTALIEFADAPVVETKETTENLYIDLDENGDLVSMTIEHAKKRPIFLKCHICKWKGAMPNKSFQRTDDSRR